MTAIQIDFVDADDAHDVFFPSAVDVPHGGSEKDLCRSPPASWRFRVHDMSGIDPFREKTDPPIDLAQPPFAVLIVGIFTAVAVARRPGHHRGHRRPFPGEQKPELVPKTLQAAGGDVVLDGFLRDRRAHPTPTLGPASAMKRLAQDPCASY